MKDNGRRETWSDDEPLFVLRYRRLHVIFRAICCGLVAAFFAGVSFIPPYMGPLDLILRPFSVFLFLVFISSLMGLLLFKEVRLYTDRIVLAQKWLDERHIGLSNAWFVNSLRGPTSKSVFSQETNMNLAWLLSVFSFRGISYYEDLADPRDAGKLNALLALLSGRRVTEFDQPAGKMFRLIEDGSEPRIVDKQALDAALSQKMESNGFDRTANIALLIAILVIMLGYVILLWPFIRSALR